MQLPARRHRQTHSRGQALVELAIILPVLALLLVMAIDFGRVFFGWIALENAARIGADQAASFADAWPAASHPDPISQQRRDIYEQLVLNDLQAINCNPDPDGDGVAVGDPVFQNADGSSTAPTNENGDQVVVTLDCEFGLLTPLAESLFGGPVAVHAEAVFAITRNATLALPSVTPPTPTPAPCTTPTADFTTSPPPGPNGRVTGSGSVNVAFMDASTAPGTCPITDWAWSYGDGPPDPDATTPNTSHTFVYGGSGGFTEYTVTLTVTNSAGTDDQTITVRVTKP